MTRKNAPLTVEGRCWLIERCRTRPIAHAVAEMGISRARTSKWVNRWRAHGELGLLDQSSTPHHGAGASPAAVVAQIETRLHEGLEYRTPVEAEAAFTEAEVTAPAVP